jgi:uncharacterized cofD-like protein
MINIVTIGGGTGSYTTLSGLKKLDNVSLKALVSMADDGGSTGVLRDELGVLPPGDVRQCLVALSEHSEIVRSLINYRFSEGTLKGHNFGNIFLAALEKVTGDFSKGVEVASEILKVNGTVIPITKDKAELGIALVDGTLLQGENNIQDADLQNVSIDKIFYKNNVALSESAQNAIHEADFIILGPGNYYCSLVPNLIVNGFKEALRDSKAKIIMPINLTNKNGHTIKWKVSTYVNQTEKYLNRKIDFVLINNENPSREQVEKYKLEEGDGVLVEDDFKDPRGVRVPLLSHLFFDKSANDIFPSSKGFIRHDSDLLKEAINKIINLPVKVAK